MKAALITEEQIKAIEDALEDMLSGWKYIRESHGDLYGIGWDRAESKAVKALTIVRSLKVQEPVAWITRRTGDGGVVISGYETCEPTDYDAIPVYTAPTKREWQALAQPEQEPVAWRWENNGSDNWIRKYTYLDNGAPDEPELCEALYTAPPSKPINFLVNGTRYKVTGLHDSGAIMGLPENLNGQWVALVDATDDKHLQYTAPPSKPWVSLTDEDMCEAFTPGDSYADYARAIEAKLKEKNHGN